MGNKFSSFSIFPTVHCDESATMPPVSVTEGLHGTGLPYPGIFQELNTMKSVNVEEIEGVQAMITYPIRASEEGNLMTQHNVMMGGQQDGYNFVAAFDSKTTSMSALFTPQLLMQASFKQVFDPTDLNITTLLTPAGIDSIRGELKLKGDDHSCVLTASHGARMGGNALNVQYLQSVTKDLKVGGGLNLLLDSSKLGLNFNSLWEPIKGTEILASYEEDKKALTTRYLRTIDDRFKFMSELKVTDAESKVILGYDMPIRLEEGTFPYTTLKGRFDCAEMRFVAGVEHTLLHGQGKVQLAFGLNHKREEYSFGLGLQMQA